ncbi:hypothetical protein BHF70_08440 [Anaerostipes sp. 494a]|uniref:DMT family transporter n=1 Tax=Anaerostipes TaxID=207244 RepID=UPI0009518FED|nr:MULTISPECIES: DMT family transporter [Anaerostipes]OLR59633.1 hypothetical protein BHF70_08440 [Anaerostipes sp. 494a]
MCSEIYKNKKMMPVLALLCALLWALAYPFIKLGYRELGIEANDLGSKILFAGIRFLFSGLLVLLISGKKLVSRSRINKNIWRWLLLFALINTSLHYLFSYIGLGYIPSSRDTIIDSMGSFFLILLSCMIFADDRMTVYKAMGCILGFGGIILMNVEPGYLSILQKCGICPYLESF